MINWNMITDSLTGNAGHTIDFNTSWDNSNPAYKEIYKLLTDANVDFNTAQWINYYPGKDFDNLVVEAFANTVGLTSIRAWISKVNPGYYVPYHWDIDDNESSYLQLGTLHRFTCFIGEPNIGQVFMIGNEYLYNQPQGTIYNWPDYKAWHASTNASLKPKYLFHFIGY